MTEFNLDINKVIEIIGMIFNLSFLFLIIYKLRIAWIFGILGSAISIYLFLLPSVKLYSEAILYLYYVVIGIYAWITWGKENIKENTILIETKSYLYHLKTIILGIILTLILGYVFDTLSEANNPYMDSFSTIFSFIATYLQAKKVLSSWIYWIILNLFSIYLYLLRDLDIYSIQMFIYFIGSIWGLYNWKKIYNKQKST